MKIITFAEINSTLRDAQPIDTEKLTELLFGLTNNGRICNRFLNYLTGKFSFAKEAVIEIDGKETKCSFLAYDFYTDTVIATYTDDECLLYIRILANEWPNI